LSHQAPWKSIKQWFCWYNTYCTVWVDLSINLRIYRPFVCLQLGTSIYRSLCIYSLIYRILLYILYSTLIPSNLYNLYII
jgi:hypothetical protein